MVTLSEVLATEIQVDVVACPDPGASVRWVATNEMADPSPFLEGGELLLFTGLETRDWGPAEWRRYAEHLRASRVSALGLAIGLTHQEVPDDLAAACADRNINLLSIPMGTSFVSISQAVASLVDDRDQIAAREAIALQRRLAQAARRRDAATSIANELASHLSGSVWLLNPDGALLSQATYGARLESDLDEIRSEVAGILSRGLGAMASWASPLGSTLVQPVGLREPPEAYIAVRSHDPLTDYQRTAVMTSTALLSLELDRRHEQRESVRKLRRRALDLLLTGELRAAEIIIEAAEQGAPGAAPLSASVAVVRARAPRENLLRLQARAEATVERGLVAMSADDTELHVLCAASEIDDWVGLLARDQVRVGAGSPVRATDVERSFRSAGFALEQATAQRPAVTWQDLSNTGVTALAAPDALEAFAEELLGRLDGAASGREQLTSVASSFIRHHGRVNVVAEDLSMHRNTVRGRIREIEHALGATLDDPTVRLNLWSALQISSGLSAE